MSDQEVQGMLIQIEATTAQLRRELAQADRVVASTTADIERRLSSIDSAFEESGRAAQRAGTLIRGAFAAVAGAGLVGGVIRQVDAYGQMADRLRLATKGTDDYSIVQQRLLQTANETYRPLAEAQELYIRTAATMRDLGFNTEKTLDITDSFSFLLVTNAASADRAKSALDAYSDALQTGKLEADGWKSIQTAMPTIAEAVATATGKSAKEVRRLGAEGKLSIETLNEGLYKTLEANRETAAKMTVSVQDALTRIQNSVTTFLGGVNDKTGALDGLASVLGVVADNVDNLAIVVGGAGAAALVLYSSKAAIATVSTLRAAGAAVYDRKVRIDQAQAVLQAAIADQRKAETATILAAREAAAARGTAVQTQMSIQLANARQREASATAAVATAQAGLRTASASMLAVLGGPVGLALLAGTAAASFLLLRDNADKASVSMEDMQKPVQQLREEFKKLNRDQREASVVKWTQEQVNATDKVKAAYGDLSQSIRAATVTASARDSGGQYTQQLQDYAAIVARLNEARKSGEDLAPVLRDVGQRLNLPGTTIDTWIEQAGAVSDADQRSAMIAETLRVLTGAMDENTASTRQNNAAKAGLSTVGQNYLETLQKQLAGLQDNGDALKAANRYIADNTELTEADRVAILSAAHAIESQKKANQAATEVGRDRTKALKDELKALDAIIDRALPEKKRLADLVEGIEGLRKAHAQGALSALEMETGIRNLNEAYADVSLQQRAREEQKLAEARRNSAEAYRAAMEVVLQARQDAINSDVAGIGLGDDEREQTQRLDEVRAKYADLRRELEQQQEDASRRLSPAAYEQRLADLADFQARELQMEVDGYAARLEAQADYRNGARRAWQNIQADAADVAGATDDMLTTGFRTAQDAITEFATTGKASFSDFATSVITDMARIAAQQASSSLLSSLVGVGVSAFSSWAGGAAAGSGAVASDYTGSAYSSWAAAQADGGGWSGGVQFFAKGAGFTNSIVSTPTAFGMAGGDMGVMGEAGPEAIMPLARAADGSLGVRAVGGGSDSSGTVLQISAPVSVSVPDRSDEGMQLDEQALQSNLQAQMKVAAEKAVADSWRAGGISYRHVNGRG